MVRRICAVLLFWGGLLAPLAADAFEPLLPQVYDESREVSGWLMSEKLDGVRGYWDGARLWSKQGHLLQPPALFTSGWPTFPLEGELWGGRGTFAATAATLQRAPGDSGWLQLQFAIFDAPAVPGPFRSRLAAIEAWFAAHPAPHAFVIPQRPVAGRAELLAELKRIEADGGEGLIVRDPAASYAGGRRPEILKVKSALDGEALVVGHLPGSGRLAGMLGALLVELADGTRFKIGTGFSDAERRHPPPPGATITFRYYGHYPSGIPKFLVFVRIRADQGL
ncbi:DNA ligase [Desulfuromonas sp. DDH964]|uniref:DNA ligase n=1 Tax=Desulfuromonas sp. DDH964 TaxID=1823759 RepID=UPI00078B509F|nr:DNA ligase [Desulfuromonas sp. DDH964]AMV71563.1 DNA ligase [Desulfuromonas sp. DDH964]